MLNITPVAVNSLVATGNRLCRKGWLKTEFVDVLMALWTKTSCEQHKKQLTAQMDYFNWQLHCELSSVASMLTRVTGLLAGDFFARVVFTDTAHDRHYCSWDVLESSYGKEGYNVLSLRLYQSPTNPNKQAVVFETSLGLKGKAYWDFDKLEIYSEEL